MSDIFIDFYVRTPETSDTEYVYSIGDSSCTLVTPEMRGRLGLMELDQYSPLNKQFKISSSDKWNIPFFRGVICHLHIPNEYATLEQWKVFCGHVKIQFDNGWVILPSNLQTNPNTLSMIQGHREVTNSDACEQLIKRFNSVYTSELPSEQLLQIITDVCNEYIPASYGVQPQSKFL
jgi:hypothetical protein